MSQPSSSSAVNAVANPFIDFHLPSATDVSDAVYHVATRLGTMTREWWREKLEKIWSVALQIIFTIGACFLFLANSSLFLLGFSIGLLSSSTMKALTGTIEDVAKKILEEKKYVQIGVMTVAVFVAWPAAFAIGAFFAGGYIGQTLVGVAGGVPVPNPPAACPCCCHHAQQHEELPAPREGTRALNADDISLV